MWTGCRQRHPVRQQNKMDLCTSHLTLLPNLGRAEWRLESPGDRLANLFVEGPDVVIDELC